MYSENLLEYQAPYFAAQGALVAALYESEGKREGVLIQ